MRRNVQISVIFCKAVFSMIAPLFLMALFAAIFKLPLLSMLTLITWPVLSLLLLVAIDKPDFWKGRFRHIKKSSLATVGVAAILVLVIVGFAFGSMNF